MLAEVRGAEHVGDFVGKSANGDGVALEVSFAGEVEELLGDAFGAEGFVANDLQVVSDIGGGGAAFVQSAEDGFGVAAHDGEGVVDFVGDSGGEKTHAGQALGNGQLAALVGDAAFEVVAEGFEFGGHAVEVGLEVGEFAVTARGEAGGEFSAGNAANAVADVAEGADDGAVLQKTDGDGGGEDDSEEDDEPDEDGAEARFGAGVDEGDGAFEFVDEVAEVVMCCEEESRLVGSERGGVNRMGADAVAQSLEGLSRAAGEELFGACVFGFEDGGADLLELVELGEFVDGGGQFVDGVGAAALGEAERSGPDVAFGAADVAELVEFFASGGSHVLENH